MKEKEKMLVLLNQLGDALSNGETEKQKNLLSELENNLVFKDQEQKEKWLDMVATFTEWGNFETMTKNLINQQKKRWCYLSTYNRLETLKEIRRELAKMGATVLIPSYYELYEMEVMTRDDDTDKVKKLKEQCKNIFVLRGDCGEGLSLDFVLNGFYYHLSYDENPFFPCMYNKIKITNEGDYFGTRYLYSSEDLNNKLWAKNKTLCFSFGYDDFFKICTDETIKECATYHLEQIKKEIVEGSESSSYTDQYNPKDKRDNIFNSSKGFYYNKRPMTKEEIERGF